MRSPLLLRRVVWQALVGWLLVAPLACAPRTAPSQVVARGDDRGREIDSLPRLPAVASPTEPNVAPRPYDSAPPPKATPSPLEVCPLGMASDGYRCTTTTCTRGQEFVEGYGCSPTLEQDGLRRPSTKLRDADPFASVHLSSCRTATGPTGPGAAVVTFDATGKVAHVELNDPFRATNVGACIVGLLSSVRLERADAPRTIRVLMFAL